jgi:hypothetical protein
VFQKLSTNAEVYCIIHTDSVCPHPPKQNRKTLIYIFMFLSLKFEYFSLPFQLTWFKNGQRIVQSQKYHTSFSNQQATLNIVNAHSEDSGHYTLLAENPQGQFSLSCIVSLGM